MKEPAGFSIFNLSIWEPTPSSAPSPAPTPAPGPAPVVVPAPSEYSVEKSVYPASGVSVPDVLLGIGGLYLAYKLILAIPSGGLSLAFP